MMRQRIMGHVRRSGLVALFICAVTSLAGAAPAVDPGQINVAPFAGQPIQIFVAGGDAVQGMSFLVQIGDGLAGPVFESADVLGGTIFAGNNLGLFGGSYVDDRYLYQGVVTASGTVNAAGLLATVTLDASACGRGYYPLKLSNALEQAELDFAGVPADLTDGVLFVPSGGDADFSDTVDVSDLGILAGNWNTTGAGWSQADFNNDGSVDVSDLGILAGNWGFDGSAVPEPASLTMILMAGGAALLRRRS